MMYFEKLNITLSHHELFSKCVRGMCAWVPNQYYQERNKLLLDNMAYKSILIQK